MPLRVIVTEGTGADCREACTLIDALNAEALLADRGYGSNEIIRKMAGKGMQAAIPSQKTARNNAIMTKSYAEPVI